MTLTPVGLVCLTCDTPDCASDVTAGRHDVVKAARGLGWTVQDDGSNARCPTHVEKE